MKKLKKIIKISAIVLIILLILLILGLRILNQLPTPPKDYRENITAGGPLEEKYLQNGGYEVSYYEEAALQSFEKYEIWYPSEMLTSGKTYPVIVVCNGTGWKASRSKYIYEHYASWGFIVIGNEEAYSWNAFGAEMVIRHLERLHQNTVIADKENIFYQKIDFDNIGIIGHSQGGVGVLNAITNTDHKDVYKAAIALSPTNKELAEALEWTYDASDVGIPIMLVSGEGGGDDWVVTGDGLKQIYNDIPSEKIMFRRKNTPHGDTQMSEDGYVTAWFMYWLQGDLPAGEAFFGENAEIRNNPYYQDIGTNCIGTSN